MIVIKEKQKLNLATTSGVTSRSVAGKMLLSTTDGPILERRIGRENVSFQLSPQKSFLHPWSTVVQFYEKDSGALFNTKGEAIEGWGAIVHPGFVNGLDPVAIGAHVKGTASEASSSNGSTPGSGEPSYSAPRLRSTGLDVTAEDATGGGAIAKQKDAPGLMDFPIIPLYSFKEVKLKRDVPPLLAKFGGVHSGAGMTQDGAAIDMTLSFTVNTNTSGVKRRMVLSTMIYLAMARPTKKLDVNTGGLNLITGGGVEYNVTYEQTSMQNYGTRARLLTGNIAPKTTKGPDGNAVQLQDEGLDYWPIATVYLLAESEEDYDINNSEVFVKHHCFWNLAYQFYIRPPLSLGNQQGLGGYLGVLVGRFTVAGGAIVAGIETAMNKAIADLNATIKAEGKYWHV
jgi:hypothetical protein